MMDAKELRLFKKAREQIKLLQSSSRAFDSGNVEEAINLSARVITLVDDRGGTFKSVLSHLGTKHCVPAISTSRGLRLNNLAGENVLIEFTSMEHGYVPILGRRLGAASAPLMSIDDWWNEDVILAWHNDCLSRCDLVRSLRDQDGGGHVDAALREGVYRRIVEDGETVIRAGDVIYPNVNFASMRQIAWELEASLLLPVAMRTMNKSKVGLTQADLFLEKRPFAIPTRCEVRETAIPNGNIIALEIKNFGGQLCDAHCEVSVSVDLPTQCYDENFSHLAGGNVTLTPQSEEALGVELRCIPPDVFRSVDRKELSIWVRVRLRYAECGATLPLETTIFRFSGAREFGAVPPTFADRLIIMPEIA